MISALPERTVPRPTDQHFWSRALSVQNLAAMFLFRSSASHRSRCRAGAGIIGSMAVPIQLSAVLLVQMEILQELLESRLSPQAVKHRVDSGRHQPDWMFVKHVFEPVQGTIIFTMARERISKN